MNPFEMVVLIVAIVMIASVFRAKYGYSRHGNRIENAEDRVENQRLRGQVQQLQERVRVLERIVTDRGADTAAQIEALRERDKIPEEDQG